MYDCDLVKVVGGVFVCWESVMVWDKEDENYEGIIVFVFIFDEDNF